MIAEISLREDLHTYHSFARGLHFANDADHCVGFGVHMPADWVDAYQVHVYPRRLRRGAQRFDAVAGAAMGADNSLLLRVGEDVHHAAVAVGPVTLCKAMHQRDIDVV